MADEMRTYMVGLLESYLVTVEALEAYLTGETRPTKPEKVFSTKSAKRCQIIQRKAVLIRKSFIGVRE